MRVSSSLTILNLLFICSQTLHQINKQPMTNGQQTDCHCYEREIYIINTYIWFRSSSLQWLYIMISADVGRHSRGSQDLYPVWIWRYISFSLHKLAWTQDVCMGVWYIQVKKMMHSWSSMICTNKTWFYQTPHIHC